MSTLNLSWSTAHFVELSYVARSLSEIERCQKHYIAENSLKLKERDRESDVTLTNRSITCSHLLGLYYALAHWCSYAVCWVWDKFECITVLNAVRFTQTYAGNNACSVLYTYVLNDWMRYVDERTYMNTMHTVLDYILSMMINRRVEFTINTNTIHFVSVCVKHMRMFAYVAANIYIHMFCSSGWYVVVVEGCRRWAMMYSFVVYALRLQYCAPRCRRPRRICRNNTHARFFSAYRYKGI